MRRWTSTFAAIGWVLLGVLIGSLIPFPEARVLGQAVLSASPARVAETTILFQRICSEILAPTPLGRHYLELGYGHWSELGRLLWYDEVTTEQTWRVIDLYTPAVKDLLDGGGKTERVSAEMIVELQRFLSEIEKRADPDLARIIREEREKVPWDEFVGLSVGEAWEKLQQVAPTE